MIRLIDKNDIIQLTGYTNSQSAHLIRLAKEKLVKDGFYWYKNKKVGRVPIQTIEAILGFPLSEKNDIIDDVLQNAGLHHGGQQ